MGSDVRPCDWAGMPPYQLLAVPDFSFILHNDATAAAASFQAVGAEAALEVVQFPDAGSLDGREQRLEPTAEEHERAGAVATLVAQHVRGILLLRAPRQTVHRLAVDHARADEAHAAHGIGFAEACLPMRVYCSVRM